MHDVSIAVVVPSYRRPTALARCLEALVHQISPADRIVIVARSGDHDTVSVAKDFVSKHPCVEIASVDAGGWVAAVATGILRCDEDVVAHTDDDAAPRPDWLARLRAQYGPDVGGVGGRDVIAGSDPGRTVPAHKVGRVTWYGRMTGSHHLGSGPPARTHVLKGANMSLRRQLWRLDSALRGDGAQVHMEIGLCAHVRRDRWRLIYDPGTVVDHFPAARHDEDDRDSPTRRARENAEWNYAYSVARYFSIWRIPTVLTYATVVGYRSAPGFVTWLEACFRKSDDAVACTRLFGVLTRARLRGTVVGIATRFGRL